MKRDIELIRMVMLAAEESKDPYELVDPKFEGHNETEISYHIALLDDAGLLHGQDRSAIGVFRWSAGALTWAGHEFVEAVRDDSVWKEARAITAKSGDGTVFEILNKALMQVLEKRTGLEKSA
ncbi:MAG: DUF2513 domain-containing protein [Gammaproteobacteria bacterium]|nr:DUF2513 domain-containing protein [Gammaproteobacteria bacterium]